MRRAPGLSRVLAAAVLAAAVTACAGIPTSGPVEAGRELRLDPENEGVPFIAEPPRPGASPEDVVRGFLRAGADFREDHAVARLYLTAPARQQWNPDAGTTVYDSITPPEASEGDVVVVSAPAVARIDEEGSYRRTSEGAVDERSFVMTRVQGEWRIARLEDGLLLSRLDVQETYRQVSLYFLAPARNTLVPDPVLLPQLPGLSTQLVSRLLQGPTRELRGAVRTAFPTGTSLDVESVPVADGLATVRLDETALAADEDDREAMSAQIVWTLKQLGPEVSRVSITAGDEDLVTSGVAAEQPRDSWGSFDPDGLRADPSVYVVGDGAVRRLVDGTFEPVAGAAGTGEVALRTPAVSGDLARVAAVSADGATLFTGRLEPDAALTAVAQGRDLGAPSWDPLGNLWFLDRTDGVLWVLPDGGTRALRVGVPTDLPGPLSAVAVSRNGVRVAVLAGRGGAARLLVGAITGADLLEGDESAEDTVGVGGLEEPVPGLRAVRDVAWADSGTLVALGSQDGLPVRPVYLSVDGFERVDVEPLSRLVSVTAAPSPAENPLVGATSRGEIVQSSSGRGWVSLGEGSDPTYSG